LGGGGETKCNVELLRDGDEDDGNERAIEEEEPYADGNDSKKLEGDTGGELRSARIVVD
jgi:hypothetical protein